jgi:hypothetical protein
LATTSAIPPGAAVHSITIDFTGLCNADAG